METTNLNHSARINMVYLAPYDVVVAVTGNINQGVLSEPIMLILSGADAEFFAHGPPAIYDPAAGRSLSNPLFTPVRDARASRDDDRWRGEATFTWNLRVGKNFNIMDRYRLEAAVDIYNVFNSGAHPVDFYGVIQPYYPDRLGELSTGTYQQPRAAKATIKLTF
jgi:hypothetical protein